MELLQVGSGSVFEHAITLQCGLAIVQSLCHLPTRHIVLFQYNKLLCAPPHPPHPKCVVLPQEESSTSQDGSQKFFSTLSAMGGCDFVGFNHMWVKMKMVLSSHTPTCLVFAQGFYDDILTSQL